MNLVTRLLEIWYNDAVNNKERKLRMKKLIVGIGIAAALCGCGNLDMFDNNFTFDTALVHWPDGTMKKIQIKQLREFKGEQIQIIGKDGKIYLVSMNNAVLIRN